MAKPVQKAAPATKKAVQKPTPVAKAAVKAAPAKKVAAPVAKVSAVIKPIKEVFTKAALVEHLATQSGVESKGVKAVLAALEAAVLGSVHKKGQGEFTLPGLLKIGVQKIEAKKKRFGKDPFSGQDRWFPAKPASVRIKARALKKLKDAAA
ncbi:HU family DNA-binding protein [Ottowia thiooxydans]|uniref:HU family DNA-binding protein n=1 Tax=Ottowia thiooxydans TaxID=219182 RepID=UPI00048B403F